MGPTEKEIQLTDVQFIFILYLQYEKQARHSTINVFLLS